MLSQCGAGADPMRAHIRSNAWCRVLVAFPGVTHERIEYLRRRVPDTLFPWDADYDRQRMIWNKAVNQYPAVIARCASTAQVQHALRWAGAHGMRVHVRSGGHSIEGFCVGTGMVVDVSRIGRVRVFDGGRHVAVGGGVLAGALCEALAPHGLLVPLGSCPNVGVAGLALGGGWGYLCRRYGLTCDGLVGVRMVLAPGAGAGAGERGATAPLPPVVTAKTGGREHGDLLWACRGAAAGGLLGVVTRMVFRTHPVPEHGLALVELLWDWQHARRLIAAWQAWAPRRADRRLTLALQLLGPEKGVRLFGVHAGSPDSARRLVLDGWVHRRPCSQGHASPPAPARHASCPRHERADAACRGCCAACRSGCMAGACPRCEHAVAEATRADAAHVGRWPCGAVQVHDTERLRADMHLPLPAPRTARFEGGDPAAIMRMGAAPNLGPPHQRTLTAMWARPLDAAGVDALAALGDHIRDDLEVHEGISLNPLCGAVSDVPADATAWWHRDPDCALGWMSFNAAWTDQLDQRREEQHVRQMYDTMRARSPDAVTEHVYVNFPDLGLVRPAHAYWGPTLGRLRAVKARYDPDGFFDQPHGLHDG